MRGSLGWARLGLVSAGVLAYSNSFGGSFLLDDFIHIVGNPRIQQFASPLGWLAGTTRPLVALSLALNYRLGGLNVWGYHAVNLAIHVSAGLTLFELLRRTFLAPRLSARWGPQATGLAFSIALLWLLHPLQTQAVTYIVQRAESLMSLFALLTLYSVVRSAQSEHPRRWKVAAILSCSLGMISKPTMATAPGIVLLYDRIFLAPSWRALFRRRGKLYAGLAATWILLALCLASGAQEFKGSAGFSPRLASPLQYALSQPSAILHYLRLSFWPQPLLIDYNWPLPTFSQALPQLLAVLLLIALPLTLLRSYPAAGFLGASFFLILAPTSSFIPLADPLFEHRMVLPLASVMTGSVLLACAVLQRALSRSPRLLRGVAATATLLAALGLGAQTYARNEDYRDPITLWVDSIARGNNSPRAYSNLGVALHRKGRLHAAAAAYRIAIQRDPQMPQPYNNLGAALLHRGDLEQAALFLRAALELDPRYPEAHSNLGTIHLRRGELDPAEAEFLETLRLNPFYAEAHVGLGTVFERRGDRPQARAEYARALKLNPALEEAAQGLERLQQEGK